MRSLPIRGFVWLGAFVLVAVSVVAAGGPHPGQAAGDRPLLRIGLVADVQYRDADPQGTRFYRESLDKLDQAVTRMNAASPDFVVQLGDLIDGRFDSYDRVLPILERLEAPRYDVLGNHDVMVEAEHQPEVLHRLGLDRLGTGKGYYDFGRSGWRFVVLNGNDLSLLANPPGSPPFLESERVLTGLKKTGARNAEIYNGAVGRAQMTWLGGTLARARDAGERVIVFCHFPVYPPNPATLWNDADVMAALDADPGVVAAYICGHKHEGDYAVRNGIHYLNLHGMVEDHDSAYALLDVYPGELKVTGFGREPARTLVLAAPAR